MIREIEIAKAICVTCDETIGPDLSEDVGHTVAKEHRNHDVQVNSWTEEYTVNCIECGEDAVTEREVGYADGVVRKVPLCETHADKL